MSPLRVVVAGVFLFFFNLFFLSLQVKEFPPWHNIRTFLSSCHRLRALPWASMVEMPPWFIYSYLKCHSLSPSTCLARNSISLKNWETPTGQTSSVLLKLKINFMVRAALAKAANMSAWKKELKACVTSPTVVIHGQSPFLIRLQ